MLIDIDGFAYNVERTGTGTPLVVLPGFTGSIAAMHDFIHGVAIAHEVVAIDLPGHGGSDAPSSPERYAMNHVADDLAAIVERLGITDAAWFGYSLGGRTALTVAVRSPHAVRALILEGASAGISDRTLRLARIADDEALAAAIERDGVAAFVERWEQLPLFATQTTLPAPKRAAIRTQRRANRAHGLAQSLRGMGSGAQDPLHDRLAYIAAPTLLIAGALDAKFRAIATEIAVAMPHARAAFVAAAGHAAHVERPGAVVQLVGDFLAETAIHRFDTIGRT